MASDRAFERAPEPASARTRPASRATTRAATLVACALAALACPIHAADLPPDQEANADLDADLSPSIAPLSWQTVPLDNVLLARDIADTFLPDWTIAATADLTIPYAAQLRIHFAEWFLPGDDAIDGAMLRITSLADGATQTLGPAQMRAWSGAPAYFNGNALRVELLVRGSRDLWSTASARAAFAEALNAPTYSSRSICDSVDDRIPEVDPIMARIWPIGCSATIIDDANASFLSAGHCGPASGSVVQFNVPLSASNGSPISPPPDDQFPIDFASVQRQSIGTGNDWSYFAAFTNATTLTPSQRQGPGANVAPASPTTVGTPLRLSGFGTTSSPISPTWNQALKTHQGPLHAIIDTRLRHRVDTTGGNSGSGIMLDLGPAGASRTLVGIHTHAGCSASSTSSNVATVIQHPALRSALANPIGLCASGTSPIESPGLGSMWIAQDAANNVGILRVDLPAGAFASRAQIPASIQAMAYDAPSSRLIALTSQRGVYAINPAASEFTLLGTITAADATSLPTLTGLAITPADPAPGLWFAIAQSTSDLYRINPQTLQAQRLTSLGNPGQLRLGALEADTDPRFLLALDDSPGGTRLIEIDLSPSVPSFRIVGALGIGATDCNALARTGDGRWITLDVPTGRLLEINRQSGAATFLANVQGVFLTAGGLAWANAPTCISDFDQSGGIEGQDLASFFEAFEAGSPAADLDQSGGIDASDIATFIRAFEAGC